VHRESGEVFWRKDGTSFPVEYSSSPIFDQNNLVGAVVTFTDITARKQMEQALIEKERLSAIGELAAGVAHDFNNSLQIISGNVELALASLGLPQGTLELLEAIRKSSITATARVRQLQRFTKNESVKNYHPIDVNQLLTDLLFQLKPMWKDIAEAQGLEFYFKNSFLAELPYTLGDIGELNSVFHNQLKNAIEAMPTGGTITIKTGITDQYVFVRITDTGIGMSEETKKRIFQPFFTTKGFDAGRGLGMASVYSIVAAHNGKISVKKTTPDKGTTMEVLLPSSQIVTEVKASPAKTLEVYPISARVLWVDDEEPIRLFAGKLIQLLGHPCDVAASGHEALELLKSNQYDLLITDIGMPGMSGWQLADAVKGKYDPMKVAVITGWGSDVTNEQKLQHGVGYVLDKPAPIDEIKRLIGEVLQLKG
jgi:CheY-like chemotaxis protein/nitrogen-specific signal transduction histidine kinase